MPKTKATHTTQSGCGRKARTAGSSPNSRARVRAIAVPMVSLRMVVSAPANRAVPDTRWRLVSSFIALVNAMPGSNTISDAMITVLRLSGASRLATAIATEPATSPATASEASCRRGRDCATKSSRPSNKPMMPAVPMSSHGRRSNPATAAEASPNPNTCIARQRTDGGSANVRSATRPAATSSSPAITCSAMRSASHSLYRSLSPRPTRITRVVSEAPAGRVGSLNDKIIPVGLTHGSHSSPSRLATDSIAPSSRCAVVP